MPIITDEQMKEISDVLGEAYSRESDAIGDSETPGTMTFEINKLNSFIDGNTPYLGLLSGFAITAYSGNQLQVASGVVIYDSNAYSVASSIISVAKTFQYDFAAACHYGFVIGFNKDDLDANAISYKSTLSNTLTASTSTYVEIDDTALLSSVAAPFTLTIDGESIEIWSVNSSNQCLIAPHYNSGTVVNSHAIGVSVFINKPLIPQVFFGLPVSASYQSGGDPTTFEYYPPVSEEDYLLICRGLATNPNTVDTARTPSLVGGISGVEDLREFVDVPSTDLFSTLEKSNIKAASNAAYYAASALSNSQSCINVLNALKEFTNLETGYTFEQYWNNRPFVAKSNYLRGESFNGITRFEFSDSFKNMYYNTYNSELLSTMAIFRGDIYGGTQTYGSPPSSVTGTYETVTAAVDGNLSYGTWIYRVTAVTASGESSISTATPVAIPVAAGSFNKVVLSWSAVSGALYYNVYRMGMSGVNYVEYLITSPGTVLTNSYEDKGTTSGTAVNRGIVFSGKTLNVATQLQLYVPPVSGNFNLFEDGAGLNTSYTESTTIQNELVFQVYGVKSDLTVGGPHSITVPQGTSRSTKYAVGSASDLYIGVYDVTFAPGTTLNIQSGNIMWSPYDLVVVQNI